MSKKTLFIVTLVIFFLAFRNWLLPASPNVASDLGYNFKSYSSSFEFPWAWTNILTSNGLGVDTLITLWTYPVQLVFQIFLKLGIPFWFQMKYLTFIPLLLIAWFGIKRLSAVLKINSHISVLVYCLNPYFLSILDGGQLNLCLAYSLIPLAIYTYVASYNRRSRFLYLVTSLIWITSCFDLRVSILETLIFFLLSLSRHKILHFVKYALISTPLLIVWHLFWIVPVFIYPQSLDPVNYSTNLNVDTLSFSTLIHSLILQPANWYKNVYGQTEQARWYLYLIPLIALTSLKYIKKTFIKAFALVLLCGIFFTKGSQPPFGEVYQFFYAHLPGFAFFRDSTKFFMLISISYAVMFGTVAEFAKKQKFVLTVILLSVCICVWPVFSDKLTGTFSRPYLQYEVMDSWKLFINPQEDFRTVWYPRKLPLGYYSSSTPSIDLIDLINIRPFMTNINGSYESLNFLRSPAAPILLRAASVKYFMFPSIDQKKYSTKEEDRNYERWLKNYFRSQSWIVPLKEGPLDIYELDTPVSKIRTVNTIAWIVGPDDTYSKLAEKDFDFSKIAIVQVNQFPNLLSQMQKNNNVKNIIVLNKTSHLDAILSLVKLDNLINVSSLVAADNSDTSGWWSRSPKDFQNLKELLGEKYSINFHDFDLNKGYLISEGKHDLSIPISNSGMLFARVLESTQSGQINFNINGDNKLVSTTGSSNAFVWKKVSDKVVKGSIQVESEGAINIINALVVMTNDEFKLLESAYTSLPASEISIDQILNLQEQPTPNISWTRTNPTKYIVNPGPQAGFIIFSESYSPEWRADSANSSQLPIPIYGFLNGYYISDKNPYSLVYAPEKIIYKVLPITVIGILLPNCILLYLKIKK